MKLLILLLCPAFILSHKYVAELEDQDNPFRPCDDHPHIFLTEFVDYSKVTFETFENGTLHVQGKAEITKEIKDIVGIKINPYKKERGVYVNTVFSINRKDFCKSMFTPSEFWYSMSKNIAEEERKCPLEKGMSYNMNIFTELEFDVPDKSAEGYYKIRFEFFYESSKEIAACFDIFSFFYLL